MTPDLRSEEWSAERDLISRLRGGDERAFERLVREQGGRLLSVVLKPGT